MNKKSLLLAVLLSVVLPFTTMAQKGTPYMNGFIDSNVYTYPPLNWSFEIPEYYFHAKERGEDTANMLQNDPNTVTRLLLIGKDKRNVLYARMVPLSIYQQVGGYEQFWKTFAGVQYQQAIDFDDKPDTSLATVDISGRMFKRFEMSVKDAKGKLRDYMAVYSYMIDGKDFVVEILTNNEEDRKLLTDAFRASAAALKQ